MRVWICSAEIRTRSFGSVMELTLSAEFEARAHGTEVNMRSRGFSCHRMAEGEVGRDTQISLRCKRSTSAGDQSLSFRGEWSGLQAARRLGPCAGSEVRHSHYSWHSQAGGEREFAHCGFKFPCDRRGRYCGHMSVGRRQLRCKRYLSRTGLL